MQTKKSAEKTEKTEHRKIHWLVAFWDVVVYELAWLLFFAVAFILGLNGIKSDIIWYVPIGYVVFFIMRLVFECYSCIFRYESIGSFARELISCTLGGIVLASVAFFLNKFFGSVIIDLALTAIFLLAYVVLAMCVRIFFAMTYRYSKLDNPPVIIKPMIRLLDSMGLLDNENSNKTDIEESKEKIPSPINELQRVIDRFAIHGEVKKITQINKGYINRTYKIETLSERGHVHKYTFQRINTNVFPPVDDLMENFRLTTNHLREKNMLLGQRAQGPVQTLRLTKDGKSFLRDDSGCWRMLTYFDDVYSLDIPDDKDTFYYAGCAFGAFLREMSDVDVSRIHTVIPNFHNTKSRYLDLEASIEKDAKGRVAEVLPEIEFIRKNKDGFGVITDALEEGRIPVRVCHNDCNLNNILFDSNTHLPVAIIDLDTVMPSSPLYDYGDSMRIGTNKAKDDEKDLSKVWCDLSLYERYARGYLEACGDILTEEELNLLPYAAEIITAEDGIRFLKDHIDGDTYYHIYYPGQNLDRARTQLKLVSDMQNKRGEIVQILKRIYKELGLKSSL